MGFRWGDAEEDDEGIDELPPPQVIGPDHRGIKTKVEYKKDEETGNVVKVTTTLQVKKKMLNPMVLRRRQLAKFGDAVGQSPSDNYTVVSIEDIQLEKPRADGQSSKQDSKSEFAALGNATLLVCRTCGKKGDHWTSKCPYKDLVGSGKVSFGDKMDDETTPSSALPGGPSKPSSYVPPSLRAGAKKDGGEGSRYHNRDDSNSIRVTNLSEDTREQDLQDLFRPFGPISRIYVAFDRETGLSRGFAFINFVNRDDAVRAIKKLDGYGYDNLILRVEWATPREK